MTHYAVVQIVPQDETALAAYRAKALEAVRKHGGDGFAGGSSAETLEDTGAGATTVVVVAFPDADAAHAWINDPELADLHALRRKGAKSTIVLLPPFQPN